MKIESCPQMYLSTLSPPPARPRGKPLMALLTAKLLAWEGKFWTYEIEGLAGKFKRWRRWRVCLRFDGSPDVYRETPGKIVCARLNGEPTKFVSLLE